MLCATHDNCPCHMGVLFIYYDIACAKYGNSPCTVMLTALAIRTTDSKLSETWTNEPS